MKDLTEEGGLMELAKGDDFVFFFSFFTDDCKR